MPKINNAHPLGSARNQQQLWEDDDGNFHVLPPKDDSFRDVDIPAFLSALLSGHVARTVPQACECHGRRFVFGGRGRVAPVNVKAVAERAGVSVGTVSTVLNHPDRVRADTRARVEAALADADGGSTGRAAAHWRRSGFAT